MFIPILALLLLPVARAAGLVDDPILGDGNAAQYLDGEAWTATGSLTPSSDPVTVGALVPGDLLTDLQRAGLIADPLYELTFQGTEWDSSPWSYSTTFDVDPHILAVLQSSGGSAALVFDSVKMGADIYLNGNRLGVARDQFLRYVFPVSLDSPNSTIAPANNNLTVLFHVSADASNDEGRWQACSGAWDWAPYGTTFAPGGSHTFSKGLVKSVYLVPLPGPGALVTHIVPRVTYTGPYPTSPLADGAADPFNVTVDVVLVARQAGTGILTVSGGWAPASPVVVPVSWSSAAAETVVSVALPQAVAVQLWWPRGLGGQALYPVTVTLAPSAPGTSPATGSRRVGFRSLALVTSDDSDPAALEGINGSGNFTMRFKVNGADWYARGANMIPLEELEGRQTAAAYVASLSSAAAASHSLLRIWGGGLFLPNAFYDTCDELGVALYHDLMYGTAWFGGNSSRPSNTTTQLAEITHQVRRLSPHPSILLWNGGNEDLGRWDATVTGFLMPTVAAVDATRPVWPASPSSGWASGVDRLWGLPNGQPFVLPTGPDAGFETHGPYQHGAGFQTVNGQGALDLFPANMPPALASSTATAYGPHVRGVFASEFGCSAFSSFESMAPTLAPEHWSAMSPPMVQRNYPTNNIISVYFGNATAERWLNATGVEAFRASTYLATLGSALQQKSDIEARRSGNAWGTITWQLGEIWPTGGWGSLEYATTGWTPGQVLGGRWKPLHHMMASHLYNDQILLVSDDARVLVKNDDPINPFAGTWTTALLRVADSALVPLGNGSASLPRGANAAAWGCADGRGNPSSGDTCSPFSALLPPAGCKADGTDCILVATLVDAATGAALDTNVVQLAPPGTMLSALPAAEVVATVSGTANPDGSVAVTVRASAAALYVTLTTLDQGRFSENAFVLAGGEVRELLFLPIPGAPLPDPAALGATLRVDHLALYM